MVMHARVRAEQGRLREADEEFRRAMRLLTEEGVELSPAAGSRPHRDGRPPLRKRTTWTGRSAS